MATLTSLRHKAAQRKRTAEEEALTDLRLVIAALVEEMPGLRARRMTAAAARMSNRIEDLRRIERTLSQAARAGHDAHTLAVPRGASDSEPVAAAEAGTPETPYDDDIYHWRGSIPEALAALQDKQEGYRRALSDLPARIEAAFPDAEFFGRAMRATQIRGGGGFSDWESLPPHHRVMWTEDGDEVRRNVLQVLLARLEAPHDD